MKKGDVVVITDNHESGHPRKQYYVRHYYPIGTICEVIKGNSNSLGNCLVAAKDIYLRGKHGSQVVTHSCIESFSFKNNRGAIGLLDKDF